MVNDGMAIATDDDKPKGKPTHEIGCDLSVLSLHELENRIGLLRDEIDRIEREMATKKTSRAAAEGFFKT
jgi:uncharacterized small protein (DUF1192 family)